MWDADLDKKSKILKFGFKSMEGVHSTSQWPML